MYQGRRESYTMWRTAAGVEVAAADIRKNEEAISAV
jgi:hypothetical protein